MPVTNRLLLPALLATTILGASATFQWSTKAPMLRAQAGGAAAILGGTLVVAGGTDWENGKKQWLRDVQVYDLAANRWRTGPALPEPLAYGPVVQTANAMEILGGTSGAAISRKIYKLDTPITRWVPAGETPGPTLLARAARVGNRIFLFGGCGDVADLTQCSPQVWMREDGSPWREVAQLPGGPVSNSALAVLDGRIYLFGGCSMPVLGKLVNHAGAWSFDPQTYAWKQHRDLPAPMRGHSATSANGRILIFGGYISSAEKAAGKGPEFGFTAAVWSYDPSANSYTAEAPMPSPMTSIDFFLHNGALWGAGGEDRMRGRSSRTFTAALAPAK